MKKMLLFGMVIFCAVAAVCAALNWYLPMKALQDTAAKLFREDARVLVMEQGRTLLEAEKSGDILHGSYWMTQDSSMDFYAQFPGDFYIKVGDAIASKMGRNLSEMFDSKVLAAIEEQYISGVQLQKLAKSLGITIKSDAPSEDLLEFMQLLDKKGYEKITVTRRKEIEGYDQPDQYFYQLRVPDTRYDVYLAMPRSNEENQLTLLLYWEDACKYEVKIKGGEGLNAKLPQEKLLSDQAVDIAAGAADLGRFVWGVYKKGKAVKDR